jgi:hypothetical protein
VKPGNWSVALIAPMLFCCAAYCQWKELPSTGSPENQLPDRTKLVGQSALGPLMKASLVDVEKNAKQHRAMVHVETDGVEIVDPAAVRNEPKLDQAHIQYRLDGGAVQNSTAKTWTFEDLSSGEHRIDVMLASNDNHQLGKAKTLKVRVP